MASSSVSDSRNSVVSTVVGSSGAVALGVVATGVVL